MRYDVMEQDQSIHKPMPIIIGSPRSGTTLLRLMLDSHSELTIPPETGFLPEAMNLKGRGEKLRERFFRAVINYPRPFPNWPDFGISEESFWAALVQISPFTIAEGCRAFYRLYAAAIGKPRWGDKTPLYCRELETIRRVLPEARFIHLIRDGRDAALSLRSMHFSPGPKMETQATFWRQNILAARRAGLGHADYLEARYEDLILNPRAVLERICAFAGLSYEDSLLNYYQRAPQRLNQHTGRWRRNGDPLLTKAQRLSQQIRTTQPLDPGCVFAWKQLMTSEERVRFESTAGDLLQELGYEF